MQQNKIRYALNFMIFISVALFNTQLIPFLQEVGYNASQRGIILSINALFSIVFQMVFGFLCDRYTSLKPFFYVAYACMIGSGVILFLWTKEGFYLHLLLTSMMASMVKVVMALDETWMLYVSASKYGMCRSFAALGLCVGSPLAGLIIDSFSYVGIVFSSGAVALLTLCLAWRCDDVVYERSSDYKQMFALLKNKKYMYMVCLLFLIYMVGSADQYVVIDKLLDMEASATMIGIKWAVQSLMEIPFFLFAHRLLKKYSPYVLLGVGMAMYGVKFLLYGLSPAPIFIVLSSLLQVVTLPMVAYTSKLIFDELCPQLKASSQMFAMALFIGGSAFVTPLITSALHTFLSYNTILYICGAFALLPLLLLCMKARELKG